MARPPAGVRTLPNAHFHLPDELGGELETAGFVCEALLGVVGPSWLVPEIDAAWEEPDKRVCMIEMARMLENEPVLGPRTLGVGTVPV